MPRSMQRQEQPPTHRIPQRTVRLYPAPRAADLERQRPAVRLGSRRSTPHERDLLVAVLWLGTPQHVDMSPSTSRHTPGPYPRGIHGLDRRQSSGPWLDHAPAPHRAQRRTILGRLPSSAPREAGDHRLANAAHRPRYRGPPPGSCRPYLDELRPPRPGSPDDPVPVRDTPPLAGRFASWCRSPQPRAVALLLRLRDPHRLRPEAPRAPHRAACRHRVSRLAAAYRRPAASTSACPCRTSFRNDGSGLDRGSCSLAEETRSSCVSDHAATSIARRESARSSTRHAQVAGVGRGRETMEASGRDDSPRHSPSTQTPSLTMQVCQSGDIWTTVPGRRAIQLGAFSTSIRDVVVFRVQVCVSGG